MSQLNISIPLDKMAALIQAGHLCVADVKSLDNETKKKLWQLCLMSCKQRVHCYESLTLNNQSSDLIDEQLISMFQPN
ncbi:hypothetical protein L2735_02590 [Shewanella olleyana]|uniref:hypothetical protein n=1 Tax=Shewanella olleyana TaxID=135626 RepID=UPI00200FAD3B|nr:hypothetical protein [Shewanella olleyana]MCL1065695.1 hypothetical protein [Shewanella olleyana]